MDLQVRKYRFIQKLFKVEEDDFVLLEAQLDNFLSEKIDSKNYNQELEDASQRIDKGEYFTQDEVEEIINGWE